jgi:hypothetical protein
VIWSSSQEVESGSSEEEEAANLLIAGLYSNLRLGLEKFDKLLRENPPAAK